MYKIKVMSIISKDTSFFGIPSAAVTKANSRFGKSISINDIIHSVKMAQPLISFFTSKKGVRKVDIIKDCLCYSLGIDFSNFDFEDGYSYTLLIDRYKKKENSGRMRSAGFYHEKDAEKMKRINELDIKPVSTKQVFDFNQEFYFQPERFPNFVGGKKRNGFSSALKLGFRIRITDDKGNSVETGYIGFIDMVGTKQIIKSEKEKLEKNIISFKH